MLVPLGSVAGGGPGFPGGTGGSVGYVAVPAGVGDDAPAEAGARPLAPVSAVPSTAPPASSAAAPTISPTPAMTRFRGRRRRGPPGAAGSATYEPNVASSLTSSVSGWP